MYLRGQTCAWTYVLKLEDECFYVGATKNYTYRIHQHFAHDGGSKWCNLHAPVEVVYMKKHDSYKLAFADEKKKTVELMREHGFRKVRGADALNTQPNCYTRAALSFWIPSELREDALAGLLGEIDPDLS